MNAPKKRLGELLVEAGLINDYQLRSALAYQQQWGGRLGAALVKLNLIEEDRLLAFFARNFRLPAIDFARIRVLPAVLGLIPKEMAVRHHIMPLFIGEEGGKPFLAVAMANPTDLGGLDEVEFATRKKVRPVVAGDDAIKRAVEYYYEHKGAPPYTADAKTSADMSYNDLIRITREFLRGREEADKKAAPAPAAAKQAAAPRPRPAPAAAVPADVDDEDSVIVFGGGGERQFSLRGEDEEAVEVVVEAEEAEGVEPASDQVLRALVNILVEKGILTREELLRRLR